MNRVHEQRAPRSSTTGFFLKTLPRFWLHSARLVRAAVSRDFREGSRAGTATLRFPSLPP